jgi:chromosomal replication initiation ATPase DnaA
LKRDIVDAAPALPQLGDMRIRNYTIKANGQKTIGVIAQELQKTHPDMVHRQQDGLYAVEAPNIWLLVKAIQELKAANDNLTARVSADNAALKAASRDILQLREALEARKAAHPR